MFATVTNIIAYIPFLLLTGTMGEFLYSLPIVMTCALVASRLASMTFVPLLGYYLLRPDKKPEKPIEERRTTGFTGYYARVARSAMDHRWKVFGGSVVFLALGVFFMSQLKTSFMPDDVQYIGFHPVRPDLEADDPELLRRVMDRNTGGRFIIGDLILPGLRDSYEDTAAAAANADLLGTHPMTFADLRP